MFAAKRRLGGPAKREPKEGERVALSLRMTPDLKRKLDAAAERGGRSQSQEAEFRLEQSFARQDLLSDALTIAHSAEIAGLLLIIGTAMDNAAYRANDIASGDRENWAENEYVLDQVLQAGLAVIETFRPTGAIEAPDVDNADRIGLTAARSAVLTIAGGSKNSEIREKIFNRPHRVSVEKIRSLLGPMSKAIKVPKP